MSTNERSARNTRIRELQQHNAGKASEWILAETLWAELSEHGVDVSTIFVGPTSSPSFLAYQATLNPDLRGRADSDDLLDRACARLTDPSPPEEIATALYDQLANRPVCFSRAEDEWIFRTSLNLPLNWYNTSRLHNTLDHVSPREWEQRYKQAS